MQFFENSTGFPSFVFREFEAQPWAYDVFPPLLPFHIFHTFFVKNPRLAARQLITSHPSLLARFLAVPQELGRKEAPFGF